MEVKTIVKHCVVVFLIVLLGYLLQTSIFPSLELAGVTPNFMVMITASYGLIRGSKYGMGVGFFCGLIMDCYSGTYLGLYAIIFLYLGYISGLFKRIFYGDDIKLPLLLIGISDIIFGFLIYGIMFLFRKQYAFGFYLMNVIIPEAVYTVLVSLLAYYGILKINQWLDKDEKRSRKDLV